LSPAKRAFTSIVPDLPSFRSWCASSPKDPVTVPYPSIKRVDQGETLNVRLSPVGRSPGPSPHRRQDVFGAAADAGGPARGHPLQARVKAHPSEPCTAMSRTCSSSCASRVASSTPLRALLAKYRALPYIDILTLLD